MEATFKDPDKLGPYEVIERVGQYLPARTYLARTTDASETRMVIKHYDTSWIDESPAGISRIAVASFMADLKCFYSLGIPGVIKHIEARARWVAFEHLNLMTLAKYMAFHGPYRPEEAMDICYKVACVMREAERNDSLHLALNPRNIFIDKAGEVAIKDWLVTKDNLALFGQPQKLSYDPYDFQAPELLDLRGVSTASDIYSLALVAAYLVTGEWDIKSEIKSGGALPAEMLEPLSGLLDEDASGRVGEWSQAADIFKNWRASGRGAAQATSDRIAPAAASAMPEEVAPAVVMVDQVFEPPEEETAEAVSAESLAEEYSWEEPTAALNDAAEDPRAEDKAASVGEKPSAALASEQAQPRPATPAHSRSEPSSHDATGAGKARYKARLAEAMKSTLLSRAAVVFLVLAVAAITVGAAVSLRGTEGPEAAVTATLPSFVGMTYDEASVAAAGLGVSLAGELSWSEAAGEGTVISQDLEAGGEISPGMTCTVVVSQGPEPPASGEAATAESSGDAATAPAEGSGGGGSQEAGAGESAPAAAVSQKPVVSVSASPGSGPSSGVMVTLTATASDPDGGSIVSYSWSCGGSGSRISKEFVSSVAPTTVTVTCTVTDDEGQTSTASATISLY